MTPNIVHMMYFSGPKSRDFGFINYLAVKAAHDVQNPDAINFYYNAEPENNPHWEAIKPYVTLVQIDPPTEFQGIELEYPQYQADIVRLQKLYEHGGIYLDTDMLLLKTLTPFMDSEKSCVIGTDTADNSLKSINAGLIIAKPQSEFIKLWLDGFSGAFKPDVWSSHCVVLPAELAMANPDLVEIQATKAFLPFGFDDKSIFSEGGTSGYQYSVHLWQTIWADDLKTIDNHYLLHTKNRFTRLFGKYATPVKLKICVYTIALNEEHFVERWANSAKDADLLVIADTGSTDGTVDTARKMGITVHDICITPWRFDLARNANIALIPRDIDICICMDMDEVLEPGWREEIERVWRPDTTRLGYMFDWGCGIRFRYEKIHARHGYMWWHPVHEYPIPDGRIKEVFAETSALLVSHHPDPTKSRGQYLALLELSVKEDPACPRNSFYYGRELSFACKWSESIAELNRYLALPRATWNTERCYAYRVIGKCYEELGNQCDAEAAYHRACAEAPNTREPWCALAMLYYRQARWAESYASAMRALEIKDKALVYTADPEVWGFQAHDLASIAAWRMGMIDEARKQAEIALSFEPDNARLKANLAFVNGEQAQEAAE